MTIRGEFKPSLRVVLGISVALIVAFTLAIPAVRRMSPSAHAAPAQPEVLSSGQTAAIQGSKLLLQETGSVIYLPIVRR